MVETKAKLCAGAALLLLVIGTFGCGTTPVPHASSTAEPQAPSAETAYRMDLDIEVNGMKGVGMLVVPKAATYVIRVKAPTNPEQVMLSTCHRDYPMGKQDDKFSITYTPNAVEARGYCLIRITALGQKFTYAGAVIDILDRESLPAKVYCNGMTENAVGVSKCQSKAKLPQEIHFETPVKAGTPGNPNCPSPKALLEGRHFEIALGRGLCVYAFRETSPPHRVMRLSTYAYDLYREGAK